MSEVGMMSDTNKKIEQNIEHTNKESKQKPRESESIDYSLKEIEALAEAHNLKSETTRQALEDLLNTDPIAVQGLLEEHTNLANSRYKKLELQIDNLIAKSEEGQDKILNVLGVDYSQLPIHIRFLVPVLKTLGFKKESEKLLDHYKDSLVTKGLENYKLVLDNYIRKLNNKGEAFNQLCDKYRKKLEDYKDNSARLYSKLKSYHVLRKKLELKISELESDAIELEEQGNEDLLMQIQEEISKARSDLDKIIKQENSIIKEAESVNRVVPVVVRQYMLALKMRDIINVRSQESNLYKDRLESLTSFIVTHNLVKDTLSIIKYISNIESVQQELEEVIPPILESIDELYATEVSEIAPHIKQEDLSKATAQIAEIDEKRMLRAIDGLDKVRRMRIPY